MGGDVPFFNKKALEQKQRALNTYQENIIYLSEMTQFVVDGILEGFLNNFPKEMRFQVSPVLRNYRHQVESILNHQTSIVYATLLTLSHKFPERIQFEERDIEVICEDILGSIFALGCEFTLGEYFNVEEKAGSMSVGKYFDVVKKIDEQKIPKQIFHYYVGACKEKYPSVGFDKLRNGYYWFEQISEVITMTLEVFEYFAEEEIYFTNEEVEKFIHETVEIYKKQIVI